MNKKNDLAISAVIAALYAVMTIVLAPVSYGAMQLRVSEGLTVLSLFTPAAVPGITVGCFIANLLGPNGFVDAVIGSLASFAGCLLMRRFRKRPYAAIFWNVAVNGIVIGLMLHYFYHSGLSLWMNLMWALLGEAASCCCFGVPLYRLLKRRGKDLGL